MTRPDVSTKARKRNGGCLAEARPGPRHGERIMTETTIFVGLDVHKKTIAVATVAAHAAASVMFFGTIANELSPNLGDGLRVQAAAWG